MPKIKPVTRDEAIAFIDFERSLPLKRDTGIENCRLALEAFLESRISVVPKAKRKVKK